MANAFTKTAAIAVAAGLTLAGSAGIATDAIAQTMNSDAVATAPGVPDASSIPSGNVKLTINKRVNPTELRPANGEADSGASGKALPGVGFTAEKIDVDITKQENFNKVAELANKRDIASAEELGVKPAQTFDDTDENGQTSLDLPVGAYIIRETKTPSTDTETYVPAEPFIVFLPMTNKEGTGWNTDVQVYPKNSMAKVSKTVVDEGKNTLSNEAKGKEGEPGYLGPRPAENAVVNYTLDGLVPAAPEGRELKNVTLTDASNSAELQWDTTNNAFIEGVYVVRDGKEEAIDAANYTVNTEAAVPTTNTEGLAAAANQAFTVTVDAQKASLKPGETVRVKVKATMLKDDAASMGIENSVRESFVFRNPTGAEDEPKETPDDKVVTYVGNISVYKRGDENKALAGAEFQIGKCNSGKSGLDGDAIQTGITDADGNLTFPGLHVTDYVNDAEDTVANYCVVETKAPKGYATPKGEAATTEITLTRETANVLNEEKTAFDAAAAKNVIANGAVVDNVKKTTPTLPATGGMGVLIIVLAGLAIIGGGVYAARRNSQSA